MKIATRISHVTPDRENLRGHDLASLIAEKTFTETIWLVLRGELPNAAQTKMLDALLVAAIDHGAAPASSIAARVTASAGNPAHVALAAGILAQGDLHGGAIEGAARFFTAHVSEDPAAAVAAWRAEGKRIPGYGHKLLARDRRSEALCARAKALGLFGMHAAFAARAETELNANAKKPLPLNIDGAMAAILLDLGFEIGHMRGLFAVSRLPGLLAHAAEQSAAPNGPLRLTADEISYEGPEAP